MRKLLIWIAAAARSTPALLISGTAVLAYFLSQTIRFGREGVTLRHDARIVYDKSLTILHDGLYPARLVLGNFHDVFPYPPPAAVMFAGLAEFGPVAFMSIWLAMMAAGLFAAFRFVVTNERPEIRRSFVALMPPVMVIALNPIVYDLQNWNNNLILLGITMAAFALAATRPLASGALLAVPITLKLYVGAVLVWLALYRPRAAVACVVCLVAFWLLLPAAVFSFDQLPELYRGWLEQVTIVNLPWVYTLVAGQGRPPLISLRLAAATLTGSDPFAIPAASALAALQIAWLTVLGGYGWRAWRAGRADIRSRAALSDWAVLLLAPLPFSPWLEPYHAVPIVVALSLCLLVVFSDDSQPRDRAIAGGACLMVIAVTLPRTSFEVRGLIYLLQFMTLTIALAILRPSLARATGQAAVTGGCDSTE